MTDLYREITACRCCGSSRLETVLDLGNLCISDFVKPGDPEDRAPLELVVCLDCSLVQLRHTVERDRLYRGEYWYRSATNESMVAALRDVVEDACSRVQLEERNTILDIGCNDGTMLKMYPTARYHCIGFEPAKNLGPNLVYQDGNLAATIYRDYFPSKSPTFASALWKCKIITSIAMFYDLDDPNSFVKAIKEWLHPDGVWIVQFQDLRAMLTVNGFDNVCHEHLMYLSELAFTELVSRHGLMVTDVSTNNTNGGSVRYVVKHGDAPTPARAWTTAFGDAWELIKFGQKVDQLKKQTLDLLWKLRTDGKLVLGLGASTKFNTLAQYYDLTPGLLPAIVERAPEKVGRFTVGTHIPIISEEEGEQLEPDYYLLGPWHFVDSFRKRYATFLARGGQFILPLPVLTTLGGALWEPIKEEVYASR